MRKLHLVIIFTLFFAFSVSEVFSADKVQLRALGSFTNQIQSTMIEQPFYKKLKEENSDKFDVQFRTMDELGQKGFDALRQLESGVFDVIQMQLGYISGDDPHWQAVDLMGISANIDEAREAVEAYRDYLDKRLQKEFNGKLLALWPYGEQVFYFKDKISGLEDFKGKKIRVYTRPMAEFVKHFGATGVTLPFPEVYTSLQKGVIDGAITGTLAGNTASWFEVSNYLYVLPMGFGFQAHAANLDFWNNLTPESRDLLTKKFKELEDELWKYGKAAGDDGVICNTGKEGCQFGLKGNMTLVQPSQEDIALMKDAAKNVILKEWAIGCNKVNPKCSEEWNQLVGKIAGIEITLD